MENVLAPNAPRVPPDVVSVRCVLCIEECLHPMEQIVSILPLTRPGSDQKQFPYAPSGQ